MKAAIWWILGIIAFAILLVYPNIRTTGNAVKDSSDTFQGIVTNMNLSPGVYEGIGAYDRTCLPVEGGLTQCDGGIQISEGIVNFQYKHEMHKQKCIDREQKLKLEVFADGTARVTRL